MTIAPLSSNAPTVKPAPTEANTQPASKSAPTNVSHAQNDHDSDDGVTVNISAAASRLFAADKKGT
jgi:hypothetical protein